MEKKLSDKANKPVTGIKHDKSFGDANYDVRRIKTDTTTATKDTYSPIIDEKKVKLHVLLKEEPKQEIPESSSFSLKYSAITSKAKELIEKKI